MTDDESRQLRKEFGEISGRVWVSKIARPEEEAPALFHYTDAAGLLGILRSRSLWATDFRALNDASEMHYGMDLAHDLINESAKRDPCERKAAFLARADEFIQGAIASGATPYFVSFCGDGNLLSQWREYGGRGAGFSIAFEHDETSKAFGGSTGVLQITYDRELQRAILGDTIEEYWSLFLKWEQKCGTQRFEFDGSPEWGVEEHCLSQLASLLLTEFVTLKDPAFKEEKEWRLIRFGEGGSRRQFRTGWLGVVPYIEFTPPDGKMLPITKVVQGPTADRSSAKRAVEILLKDLGYAGVEVEVSTIPLRF